MKRDRGILLILMLVVLLVSYLYTLKGQVEITLIANTISEEAKSFYPYNIWYRFGLSSGLIIGLISIVGIWFWKKWSMHLFLISSLLISTVTIYFGFSGIQRFYALGYCTILTALGFGIIYRKFRHLSKS